MAEQMILTQQDKGSSRIDRGLGTRWGGGARSPVKRHLSESRGKGDLDHAWRDANFRRRNEKSQVRKSQEDHTGAS